MNEIEYQMGKKALQILGMIAEVDLEYSQKIINEKEFIDYVQKALRKR